jgi:glycosyltransferase involved in cell wall biosynthesis
MYFWLRFVWAAHSILPSVIYGHDYFMAFPAWIAARLLGRPFVYDAHELLVPMPGQRINWRDRFFYYCDRFTARRANLVIAANSERARIMREAYGLGALPAVVRNIPDLEIAGCEATRKPAHPTRFTCVYQGDINLIRGLALFVEMMQYLPDIHLVVIGAGPHLENLKKLASQSSASGRIEFLGKVPRAELQPILQTCHIGLITYAPTDLNTIYCAPNKLYEYAHAGLPTVATGSQYLCSMVRESGIGVGLPFDMATPQALAECVRTTQALWAEFRGRCAAFLNANSWASEALVLCDRVSQLSCDERQAVNPAVN